MNGVKAHVLALALVLTVSRAAAAPPGTPTSVESAAGAEALQLFEASRVRYRQGEFREAAELLRRAHALKPEPVLMYNLGRALEGAGDLEGAAHAYESYLSAERAAPDRRSIEGRVATIRKQIAEREALQRQREAALAREAEARRARAPLSIWVPVATGALSVGALGAGFAFGEAGRAKEQSARDEPVHLAASAHVDDAKTLATYANVAFVGSAVLAATTVVLLLVRGRSGSATGAALAPAAGGAALRGTF